MLVCQGYKQNCNPRNYFHIVRNALLKKMQEFSRYKESKQGKQIKVLYRYFGNMQIYRYYFEKI